MRNPFKQKSPWCHNGLEAAVHASPPIRYVNIMLYQMCKARHPVRVLRGEEPLSPVPLDGATLEAPPFAQVLNRLKIMSGLDPVHYAAEIEGMIRLSIAGEEFSLRTTFNDDEGERCRIEILNTDWEQNTASQDTLASSRS